MNEEANEVYMIVIPTLVIAQRYMEGGTFTYIMEESQEYITGVVLPVLGVVQRCGNYGGRRKERTRMD